MADHRSEERRTSLTPFYYPERRTGFDRRRRHAVCRVLRDNFVLLGLLILTLNLLNLADLYLTTSAFGLGAIEGNPVMAAAFNVSWETAAVFKIAVMAAISAAILVFGRYRLVLQFALASAAAYAMLIGYHVLTHAAVT